LIKWEDSHGGMGWQMMDGLADDPEPLYCKSVGWIRRENKDCIVIVPHIGGENKGDSLYQGLGKLTIPKRSILKIKILRDK